MSGEVNARQLRSRRNYESILRAVADHGPLTTTEIVDHVDLALSTVQTRVRNARNQGHLVSVQQEEFPYECQHAITSEGRDELE